MAPSNATQTQRDERVVRDADDAQQRARFLKRAFCAWVILLALFQFSENTADPDLWGHVTFGQEMLSTHSIPRTEMYSWTAAGQPWFNHEVIAEISLGAAHALLGGAGLLLLKMTVGLLAFALALKIALEEMNPGERWVAWAVGAIAVVEISFGFSARPQIFTALCVVLELLLLRRIHAGAPLWAIALPPLFVFWINTHGGVLAGVGLLGVAAVASTAQHFFSSSSQFFHASELEPHLPPHPSPLPMGEGASPAAAVETDDHGTRPRWPNSSPSPWGEGQGEGDRDSFQSETGSANAATVKLDESSCRVAPEPEHFRWINPTRSPLWRVSKLFVPTLLRAPRHRAARRSHNQDSQPTRRVSPALLQNNSNNAQTAPF